MRKNKLRRLVLVLGDQLDDQSSAFDDFNPETDAVWMAEVSGESTRVWSSKPRIAMFLAAMRHFREHLHRRGYTVHYRQLDDPANRGSLVAELQHAIVEHQPNEIVCVEPGEWSVREELQRAAGKMKREIEFREDRHFLCSRAEFAAHVKGRKQLRMEFFYREMRRKTGVLMNGTEPEGGAWNFDADNRESFGKSGPGDVTSPASFPPDDITREVLALVQTHFPKHPGQLTHFDWPLTPAQAREAFHDFIEHRLPNFGRYQDAMWSADGELMARPYLYHSRLSAAMNLKLLDPREVIAAAEQAYRSGRVPLASAEGFIRQILGWREYVRGIYWHFMPGYLERNALNATEPLPRFYWTGHTDLQCLRESIRQTLDYGYAHHIQRLMVTGLFALLVGVNPRLVHEWYLAVYVDAIEWVELPNTLGMSQHGDGGLMASKPYVASGKYIQRMSNYCTGCRYDPAKATGERACPFTTLYWDFLLRHETFLSKNQRMSMQLRNLARLSPAQRKEIQKHATDWRTRLSAVS
ncbi:MAG: cryptochrome/photolyase family protein [Verrucomicrobia bacterium]|nr:cryptochrome/photolyase family protein [Verrucomicrobiota bacterium]